MKKQTVLLLILLLFTLPASAMDVKIHINETPVDARIKATTYNGISIAETPLDARVVDQDVIIKIPDPVIVIPPIPTPVPTPTPTPTPVPTPTPGSFQLYSPTSFWNKKLTNEATHPNSAGFVPEVWENVKIAGVTVNTVNYGRPIYFLDGSITMKQKIYIPNKPGITNDIEFQKGVPMPQNVLTSGGTDAQLCIIDTTGNAEYDFQSIKFNASKNRWEASDGGILRNVSISDGTLDFRGYGDWNSATATHLPMGGGAILLSELEAGVIPHALAYSLNRTKYGTQVWPAKSNDGNYSGSNAIPEGQRFRFPADIYIDPAWPPLMKMMVVSIRDYGMVCSDKTGAGISFYAQDPRPLGQTASFITQYLAGQSWEKSFGDKNNLYPKFPWSKLIALA